MTSVVARMVYAIQKDEADPTAGNDCVAHSGRLPELLIDTFDRWKAGEVSSASINFGLAQVIPAEVVEDVFRAMQTVEART